MRWIDGMVALRMACNLSSLHAGRLVLVMTKLTPSTGQAAIFWRRGSRKETNALSTFLSYFINQGDRKKGQQIFPSQQSIED